MSEAIKVERKNEWDAGLNTTTGMWQLLSDDLADDEDVRRQINSLIHCKH